MLYCSDYPAQCTQAVLDGSRRERNAGQPILDVDDVLAGLGCTDSIQRSAHRQSSTAAGASATRASRYSTLMTAHPISSRSTRFLPTPIPLALRRQESQRVALLRSADPPSPVDLDQRRPRLLLASGKVQIELRLEAVRDVVNDVRHDAVRGCGDYGGLLGIGRLRVDRTGKHHARQNRHDSRGQSLHLALLVAGRFM